MSANSYIGTDDAGRDRYFGPLVVAAVLCNRQVSSALEHVFSERKSTAGLAAAILRIAPCEIVRISPATYNKLFIRMGSLNAILAWAHARAALTLLKGYPGTGTIVCNQFAARKTLEEAMTKERTEVEIIQLARAAESHAGVRAASVVAASTFSRSLRALGDKTGFPLPEQESLVLDTAKRIFDSHGIDGLAELAKLDFPVTSLVSSSS